MPGRSHHHLVENAGALSIRPAALSGELVDFGDYPGLRLTTENRRRVHGYLVELADPDSALPVLDEYQGPEFRREIVGVIDEAGRTYGAWVYVLTNAHPDLPIIDSGRWEPKLVRT